MIENIIEGLKVSAVGIAVVFTILTALAIILALMPKIISIKKEEEKPELQKPPQTKPLEKQEEIKEEEKINPEELAIITAAITAHNELKLRAIEEAGLKPGPLILRLLPLAGITFKTKVKLSIQGSEKTVEINEKQPGYYTIKIGPKTITAQIKPPLKEVAIKLDKQ